MSVAQVPPRTADATVSIVLGQEKVSRPLQVAIDLAGRTLDDRRAPPVPQTATKAVVPSPEEKAPDTSQAPKVEGLAREDENASNAHPAPTEADPGQDDVKNTEDPKPMANTIEDKKNPSAARDVVVVDLVFEDVQTPNISAATTEAGDDKSAKNSSPATSEESWTLDDKKAPGVSQARIEVVTPILGEDESGCTEVEETSRKILDVIFQYALNKFDDTKELHAVGAPKFLSLITGFVREGKRLEMCLPAFPFKSANKVYKVLGTLPDKAEELALGRLNSMCACIAEFYPPSAKLTIISDGLVYNDLLSISDQDTWAYGEALRIMAAQKEFTHIGFSRLRDLVTFPNMPENLQEISYVANATNFRHFLLNKYGKDDIDIDHEIATNPDTLMTYRGYCRFLESDLQYIFVTGNGRSNHGYKRDVKYLAKQMLIRGYAFAAAVKANFPDHLRLSIHQSTGEHKVSMSLLNTKTGFTTPWHCSVALMADGEWISAPMGDFKEDRLLEVIHENGRPSYFQEVMRKRPYLNDTKAYGSKQQAVKT
ncbi:hypothetical protein GQ53DRAFT_755030 [Thozetella sp. PMI_491]|nr:hypothetical protein GQ53DRAFT_755030 [Thozetella sp. PMI_491]